jgi:DNA adenine methylase
VRIIRTPVSRVGNKSAILHILYALFPLKYGRFIDVFGGSGSVLLGNPNPPPFEVYNDFDRNLTNLFHCMKERTVATVRELGFCNLNSRDDFIAVRRFFKDEQFEDKYFSEELRLTDITFPPPEAAELKEIRTRITKDYDVRRAAMFMKLLRYSYSSSCKSYASQPFDIRRLFGLITELKNRMANVVVENQDFETLIKHYDRPDSFFYADPPYFSTEDMYAVGFNLDDHVRLRDTLKNIKGKFLLSYNDCPEIRELYSGFPLFDFSRTHSMAQRYEAGKEFRELLIGNYDLYERAKNQPVQLTIFDVHSDADSEIPNYEKILKECIVSCKIKK